MTPPLHAKTVRDALLFRREERQRARSCWSEEVACVSEGAARSGASVFSVRAALFAFARGSPLALSWHQSAFLTNSPRSSSLLDGVAEPHEGLRETSPLAVLNFAFEAVPPGCADTWRDVVWPEWKEEGPPLRRTTNRRYASLSGRFVLVPVELKTPENVAALAKTSLSGLQTSAESLGCFLVKSPCVSEGQVCRATEISYFRTALKMRIHFAVKNSIRMNVDRQCGYCAVAGKQVVSLGASNWERTALLPPPKAGWAVACALRVLERH